jgi:hypothetical protein
LRRLRAGPGAAAVATDAVELERRLLRPPERLEVAVAVAVAVAAAAAVLVLRAVLRRVLLNQRPMVRAASGRFRAASTAFTACVGFAAIPSNSGWTIEPAGNWNCKVGGDEDDGEDDGEDGEADDPAAATPGLVGDGTMVNVYSYDSVTFEIV